MNANHLTTCSTTKRRLKTVPTRGTGATKRLLRYGLTLGLCLAMTPAAGAQATSESRDPKAVAVAQKSMQAMGGADAWRATRYVRFTFFGSRTHHWDRHAGRHRLEGTNREGQSYVVLMDLHTRKGKAWLDGKALEGEERDKWLEQAWGAWINDTYWLVMPYKLMDPGVNLTHDGLETVDGQSYDKLKLTFEGVGLTPGDTYWAWINRETGLMDQWAYVLQGWEDDREPTVWKWLNWKPYGNIMLSGQRKSGDREPSLSDIAVFDQLPDAVFESPAAPEG